MYFYRIIEDGQIKGYESRNVQINSARHIEITQEAFELEIEALKSVEDVAISHNILKHINSKPLYKNSIGGAEKL